VTFDVFDVVVVPFPFTERTSSKRRPALVISNPSVFGLEVGHSVLAMITSAKKSEWPLDTPIQDLACAGLSSTSVVRMKLFTLDNQLVIRKAGLLSERDRFAVRENLERLLDLHR
jgi:mRNA interferase MazF